MLVAIDCTWVQRSGKGGFGADPDFLCWQWFCWQISTSVIFVAWERFRLSGDAEPWCFWDLWGTNSQLLLLNPLSSNSRVYSWDRMFPIRFHISNSLPLSSISFKACFSVLMGVSGSEAWRNSKGVLKDWTDNLDDPELTEVSIVDPLSAGSCELMVSSVGEIESDSANSESWTSSAWEASSRSTLRSPAICGSPAKKDFPSVSVSTSASKAARRVESRGGQNSFYSQIIHRWIDGVSSY